MAVTVALTAAIIFGGLRSIALLRDRRALHGGGLPGGGAGHLLANLGKVPGALAMVSAFRPARGAAGGIGAAILNGFKRGLFSNGPAWARRQRRRRSHAYPPPGLAGYVQMAGVFIDTILICTASAAIILLAGPVRGTGIGLVQNALTSEVGRLGQVLPRRRGAVLRLHLDRRQLLLRRTAWSSSRHNHPAGLLIFRVLVLVMVMFGSIGSLPFVWNFADVTMGLMAITNLVAILLLSGLVGEAGARLQRPARRRQAAQPSTPAGVRRSAASSSRASGTGLSPATLQTAPSRPDASGVTDQARRATTAPMHSLLEFPAPSPPGARPRPPARAARQRCRGARARLVAGDYGKPFVLENGGLRALHFSLGYVQSVMDVANPAALVLAYARAR